MTKFQQFINTIKNFFLKIKIFAWSHKIISVILLVLIGLGLYFAYNSLNTKSVKPTYTTANPSFQTLNDSVTASGTVALSNLRNLNFRSAGIVDKVNFKVSDKVKAGDVIASINPKDLENTLAQSKSALKQAQNNASNRLIQNVPTQYDLANLQESVKTSEIKLATDQFNLEQTTLKSPVNGSIVTINNQVGDQITTVNASTGLPTDIDKLTQENNIKTAQSKVTQDKSNLEQVTLMSPISGKVVAVNYKEGDQVTTGSTSSSTSIYDLNNLKESIKTAQNKVNSDQVAYDKAVTLGQDTTNLTTSLNQSKSSLNQANNNLEKALNTGPGFVVIRNGQTGENQSVNFGVAGKIKTVNVIVGNEVKNGESLLGTLDPTTLQNQLEQDQATLDLAIANAQKAPNTNALMVVTNDENGGKQQNLSFLVTGRLQELKVKVGDKISKGQEIAKLDPTTYQNQLELSKSSVNQSKNNLANRYVANAPTKYDLSNLDESVNNAKIKVDTDQQNLDNAQMKSPIDGTITTLKIAQGDSVSTGNISSQTDSTSSSTSSSITNTAIVVVADLDHMVVNATVGETEIAKIKLGQLSQITFDAIGSQKQYVGKVDFIDPNPTITSNVVSYSIKIAINKIDESIKPGMSATLTIITQTKDNVLTVPSAAIKTANGGNYVQILVNGEPQNITVTTGLSTGTLTEITNGLTESDNVITSTITSTSKTGTQSALTSLGIGGGAGGRNTNRTTTSGGSTNSAPTPQAPPGF